MTCARQTSFDQVSVTGDSIFGAGAGRLPRPKPTPTHTMQGTLIPGASGGIVCPNPDVFKLRDDRADERGGMDRRLSFF